MSRIETSKVATYVALGSEADKAAVSKLTVYALLVPGSAPDESNKQGHVYAIKVAR